MKPGRAINPGLMLLAVLASWVLADKSILFPVAGLVPMWWLCRRYPAPQTQKPRRW